MANSVRLTAPQRELLAEIEAAGVLYIKDYGRYCRTAEALVRKGVAVVSEPDYSRNGQNGYSVVNGPDVAVQGRIG